MPPYRAFFRTASLAGWLAVATALAAPAPACHAQQPPVAEAPASPASKARAIPYRSVVDSISPEGSWITIGRNKVRTLQITEATRIYTGDGLPIEFAALFPGLEVRGAYRKLESGALEAITIRIGPKPSR